METGNNHTKTIHNIVDEAYNASSTLLYHLSIQIGLNEFSYCILDLKNNKFLILKSYQYDKIFNWTQLANAIENTIKTDEMLKSKYKSVSVLLEHNQFTIIPAPLFDNNNQKDYLKFNADFEQNQSFGNDILKSIEAHNVFVIPNVVEKLIFNYFGANKITHHTSALIESFIKSTKNSNEKQLFVNVHVSSFDFVLIEGNKLICCNSFHVHSKEDFIYYLLFACEQFKLNPEKIKLVVSGDIEKSSDKYTDLYKYLRNVSLIGRNNASHHSYKFDEIPEHFYYNLLNHYSA
ncbi:MAG: DUF3822 family protein [Bacteroidetes bacterium]|nr:DUF3822 family protein [Bacteroidota bacterium]HET6243650.1 DUF3822 family protein [Bacteroidia bacterium]